MKKLALIIAAASLCVNFAFAEGPQQVGQNIVQVVSKLIKSADYDTALTQLDTVFDKDPDNLLAIRLRGNVYFAEKNYDEAFEQFDRLVKRCPRGARGYFDRGIVQFARGNDNLAFDDIEKAFALNPHVIGNLETPQNFAKKIHDEREKAHVAKYQVRHKHGMINTKKGGLITKLK